MKKKQKVNIYVDFIGDGIIRGAKAVARTQRMDVVIHAPGVTTEVTYDEAKKEKEDEPETQAIIKSWFKNDQT